MNFVICLTEDISEKEYSTGLWWRRYVTKINLGITFGNHKNNNQMSFVGGYVEKRTRKNTFFKQINILIDWSEIEKEI